jgi:hypothetical protein
MEFKDDRSITVEALHPPNKFDGEICLFSDDDYGNGGGSVAINRQVCIR